MNLRRKKSLAAKALKIGKKRVVFNTEGLSEIKEAITKQDIKDLAKDGIITIKPVKGRKKIKKRKIQRGPGKIKKKVKHRKQEYVKITRKLRKYLMGLRDKGIVEREMYWDLRKKIRMRTFKSKANFKEYLKSAEIDVESVGKMKKMKNKISGQRRKGSSKQTSKSSLAGKRKSEKESSQSFQNSSDTKNVKQSSLMKSVVEQKIKKKDKKIKVKEKGK